MQFHGASQSRDHCTVFHKNARRLPGLHQHRSIACQLLQNQWINTMLCQIPNSTAIQLSPIPWHLRNPGTSHTNQFNRTAISPRTAKSKDSHHLSTPVHHHNTVQPILVPSINRGRFPKSLTDIGTGKSLIVDCREQTLAPTGALYAIACQRNRYSSSLQSSHQPLTSGQPQIATSRTILMQSEIHTQSR